LALKFSIDLLIFSIASPLAFWLRLEGTIVNYFKELAVSVSINFLFALVVIQLFGLYRSSWRKTGILDLYALLKAIGFYLIFHYLIWVFIAHYVWIPRTIPLLSAASAFLMMSAVRVSTRFFFEQKKFSSAFRGQKRVLIIGSGEAGTMVARDMLRHPETGLIPVGFLDDDPAKQRKSFLGLKVLGMLKDLRPVVAKLDVDEVLIAIPSAPGSLIRKIVQEVQKVGVRYRIIPGLYELISGNVSVSHIREVDVEDLLRREPVQLNLDEISAFLKDRVVLITGAGGSIGSELVRQVSRFHPHKVLLLGKGENSLFQIQCELDRFFPHIEYKIIVADVRDISKMEWVFEKHRPQVVLHAAAHKHVPMMEENPDEAIFNNIRGTEVVAECSLKFRVERLVNISTDKAVRPASILGASKRIAELIIQWASRRAFQGQTFVSVRFGNVLGSRGSVVPLFKEQIRWGGPVTITHPEMTRYFMTIPEAAQLVLQAGAFGQNGEIYILDMGEPVKILDLARDLIRLSGFEPEKDIPIVFTGIRPGEKLHEELFLDPNQVDKTRHEKIFVVHNTIPIDEGSFLRALQELYQASARKDKDAIRQTLKILVPNYLSKERIEAEKPIRVVKS
jgi:FlaA1/EpsC-like NDP-sugar epimerase